MGSIRIYAPGNGALDFVRVDNNGKACAPHKITMDEATQAMIAKGEAYPAFKLVEIGDGAPNLIPDVSRDSDGILHFDGAQFMQKDGEFYHFSEPLEGWHLTKNASICASLRFFLNPENARFYK